MTGAMRMGAPIASVDGGQLWPVEQKTFKSELVSHWRDSFYRKVFTGWKAIGMFTTEAKARDFIRTKLSEVKS